jgi:hypothetical protein
MIHQTLVALQRRRLAAAREPRRAQHDREARRQDVDGDAAHHLVAAPGDAGKAMQQRHRFGSEDGGGHAQPGRAGDRGSRGGKESCHQHLAFEADIDDAALLREQPAHGAQHQRRGHPQSRSQHQEGEGKHLVHYSPPSPRSGEVAALR